MHFNTFTNFASSFLSPSRHHTEKRRDKEKTEPESKKVSEGPERKLGSHERGAEVTEGKKNKDEV